MEADFLSDKHIRALEESIEYLYEDSHSISQGERVDALRELLKILKNYRIFNKRPSKEIIQDAASGDGAALAQIDKYLREYSSTLAPNQKGHLDIEMNSIILSGMDHRMKKEQMEGWGMLIEEIVKQIKSEEITNLN